MQPVLLSSMKPFNGGYKWNNAGTPQDPFGNTYTDYSVICYDEGLIQNGEQPGYAFPRFDKFYSEYYIGGSYSLL